MWTRKLLIFFTCVVLLLACGIEYFAHGGSSTKYELTTLRAHSHSASGHEAGLPAVREGNSAAERVHLTGDTSSSRQALPIYRHADFQAAAYGNPYKAVIDAHMLPPGARESVYIYVNMRCSSALVMARDQRKSAYSNGAGKESVEARSAAALLESQCAPVWQDQNVASLVTEATASMLNSRNAREQAVVKTESVADIPLEAWADLVGSRPVGGDVPEPRYFKEELWGGLGSHEQYNRAVRQAMVNLTVSPTSGAGHFEALLLCAETGNCDIPPNLIAVYDLPRRDRERVLKVAEAMQREIANGNYTAFRSPVGP